MLDLPKSKGKFSLNYLQETQVRYSCHKMNTFEKCMLSVFQTITKNVLIFKSYVVGGRFFNITNRKPLYVDATTTFDVVQ